MSVKTTQGLFFSLPSNPSRPLSSFDTHPRWLPVTQSAPSRRSYGKIGTVKCDQSVVTCIRFGSYNCKKGLNISVYIVKVENNIGKSTKTVFDWILGAAKKRQSSKKRKRPLSSSNIPAPKYPRPLEDKGKVCFCSCSNRGLSFLFMYIVYVQSTYRTYDLLVTGRDALPLNHRKLVGTEATKLGSRDKHPENCSEDYRTSMTHYIGSNTKWIMLFKKFSLSSSRAIQCRVRVIQRYLVKPIRAQPERANSEFTNGELTQKKAEVKKTAKLVLVPSRYLSVFLDERRLRIRLRRARGLMGRRSNVVTVERIFGHSTHQRNERTAFYKLMRNTPDLLFPADWYISVVVKLLKGEYKRRSQLRPLLWDNTIELPLDDVYTRLKIVSRRKADFRVDDNEVNVFDIFTALDKGEDVMTLVEGSPGIGKTTFCLKLAYDWAHGKIPAECSFPKFELMLLLKCRDIHKDIMESISEQLLPEDVEEKTKERLFNFVKDIHNQERTLIILDGLDELPKDSERYVDKLLQRRILSFCYVLATSRQERGIDVRKKYGFDILLEIKGFTESDAFDYIRKHFKNVGPLHSSKGESLIKEIEENSLLHALRNNPLNLLLLCVIYEDYEGNLPSSRSELYQVIVLCLLRRHCAKHNLEVPEENRALEKQYEETILALGELAWMCLLSDRYCFRESELAALERRYKGLVCRHVGLLYKEESLRRLKPQHEYYFLHKTFQEYLAAAFIAHKLRGNQLSLFERLSFHELAKKYREVFLFVSGVLGRDASILFTQIGEELKNWGKWDWDWCRQFGVVTMDDRKREENWDDWDSDDEEDRGWEAATFLTESFCESGHAEKVAETLCSYIPFPTHVEINLDPPPRNDESGNIYHVLDACKTFSNLQKPVRLTVHKCSQGSSYQTVAEHIQSCPQLESLAIHTPSVTLDLANALHKGLSGNTTLSKFTLQVCGSISCDVAAVIGEWLAARKFLKNVTFLLRRVKGEAWASSLETGLSADTLLSSVELSVRGSMSDTSILALGKLSLNRALTELSLNISGDMQTFIVDVIGKGIALQTVLKSLSLDIDGNLSLSGANSLKRGLLENCSLNNLRVFVFGKVPSNWQSFLETIRLAKKVSVTFDFYPDSCSRTTSNQLGNFYPGPDVVEKGLHTKQHLTVVLWGELSCDGAEAFSERLVRAPLTSLALKMHGKVTDNVAYCIASYVRRHNTLSSMTIDVWGDLAPGTRSFLQGLSNTDQTVEVKVHDVCVLPEESCNAFSVSIDSIASLKPVLYKIKSTSVEKINLKIINDDGASKEWTHLIGEALAENTTVTALDVTINNYMTNVTADFGKDLGESLLRCSSMTVLNLAINNYTKMAEGWECRLVKSLSKLASLTTLSLAIDDHGEVRTVVEESLGDGLMAMKSLSTLSVVINGSNLEKFWSYFLRKCLKENNSLSLLCVTVNNYDDDLEDPDYSFDDSFEEPYYWYDGLADGLARTTSLNELTLTINNITLISNCWVESVCKGFLENESVTTLTVTVSGDSSFPDCVSWVPKLNKGLSKNNSLTTLTLTANAYWEGERREGKDFFWADKMYTTVNASLTTLNLTINICTEVSEDWLPELCDCLVNSSSLTTFRLNVNNHFATNESRIYDFRKLRLKYRSLSTFELTVTFYGE
ncbi:unnamed protein product [Porites evermanni]|uniref:NACHT domain-containing protein n=1 Tax=Porites evermanni TaxID=104178 RepID=A0ABN8M043_9CNID|nr:unnamed protein product [Porites evermanni]